MSRNNDVFNVLVTTGDQAVLSAGDKLSDLNPGQIGVFDATTNTAIGAGTVPNKFYLAVGTADGDVVKSAGQEIQTKGIVDKSEKPYVAGQAMKVVLKNYTAEADTEYGIKLELRNQEIYRTQGYNQFTKSFIVKTGCAKPGQVTGDANEITKNLLVEIANNGDNLISAVAIARQALTAATHGVAADLAIGDVLVDGDLDALIAYNEGQTNAADYVYTDLEITTITQAAENFGNVPLKYFYPRQTGVIASKVGVANCTGEFETTQELVVEEGAGLEVKFNEYCAKGFEEGYYRVSELIGVAEDRNFNALVGTNYDQISVTYDNKSQSAWQFHEANLNTCVAIPTGGSRTYTQLNAILNAIV